MDLSERSAKIGWLSSGGLAPLAFDNHLREQARPTDQWTEVTWYWSTRNFAISPEANAAIKPMVEFAFSQQDKPMLEAQQRNLGGVDFWAGQALPSHAGAVRVRRKLDALIDKERADRIPPPAVAEPRP
jgi:vanillate O-demethylase monooxygenase subunit